MGPLCSVSTSTASSSLPVGLRTTMLGCPSGPALKTVKSKVHIPFVDCVLVKSQELKTKVGPENYFALCPNLRTKV